MASIRHEGLQYTLDSKGIKLLFVSTLSQWGSERFSFYTRIRDLVNIITAKYTDKLTDV